MKTLTKITSCKFIAAAIMLSLMDSIALAQDSTASSSVTKSSTSITTTETWYGQPWIWVLGAAILIIIIVALTRSSSTTTRNAGRVDKVTYTKKVSHEDD